MGILEPSEGSIRYKDKNVHKLKSKELVWFRKEVQAIFQDPYDTFNPMKKVETYLYETARNVLGLKSEDEATKRIEEVLEFMDLSLKDVKGKYPTEFSGGQIQRMSVARALLPRPKLILADEPVSMIDASMRINIINTFKELKDKHEISFIYITHDLATAYYVSDDIAIMYRGTVVEEGPADKVLIDQHHPYTKALVSSLPDPQKREMWLKESSTKAPEMEIKEYLAPGCRYAAICPCKLEKCDNNMPFAFIINGAKVACWLYER